VIRWLQTSLFGASADKSPASLTALGDFVLAARWKNACAGLEVDLIPVPRLRQGWRLAWRRGLTGQRAATLRVPKVFAEASDDILQALAAWTRLAMQRKSPVRRAGRLALEKSLHAWIESRHKEDGHVRKLVDGRAIRRLARLHPKGRHHDLETILAAINTEYFGGALRARITWATRWGGLSTQTMAPDGEGGTYPLLSISRGYDHPSATAAIVGGVVYHECLHIAVPPGEKNGRRVVHGREFRRREKEYRHYEEWRVWHRDVLPRIIRRGPKER
jgi:hypothetical protein